MKKIVVLNSGGFDSTTLLAELASEEQYIIHSLYFDYGQLNSLYDSKCAKENADKLGAIHHEIVLPKIEWTNSSFYDSSVNEYATQYLEMRNVIFISYALSLAESVGAEAIYAAILGNGQYKDTCAEFIQSMKELCKTLGVSFETPYSDYAKTDLFYLAKKLGVGTTFPFISCDTPINGKPCGNCADCKSLEYYNHIIKTKYAVQHFWESGLNSEDPNFKEAFLKEPISEVRVLLNNSCQLNCEHCYHNNNPLIGDTLTDEKLVDTIIAARELGIKNIHFAGKEPLFDDRMFRIIKAVKDKGFTDIDFTVVTNGINVPKYAEELKKSGISRVFLSADDEFYSSIRHTMMNTPVKNALKAIGSDIPVEIFYDLTTENISHTLDNIKYWEDIFNIRSFHIRTIRPVGSAENIPLLSVESICRLHTELKEYKTDSVIELDIGAAPYSFDILLSEDPVTEELRADVDKSVTLETTWATESYKLFFELFCNRYHTQITLTADGYVLGCAMECSERDYDKVSAGNVKDESLYNLIRKGKEQSLKVNESQCNSKCINFEKCSFTPLDF